MNYKSRILLDLIKKMLYLKKVDQDSSSHTTYNDIQIIINLIYFLAVCLFFLVLLFCVILWLCEEKPEVMSAQKVSQPDLPQQQQEIKASKQLIKGQIIAQQKHEKHLPQMPRNGINISSDQLHQKLKQSMTRACRVLIFQDLMNFYNVILSLSQLTFHFLLLVVIYRKMLTISQRNEVAQFANLYLLLIKLVISKFYGQQIRRGII